MRKQQTDASGQVEAELQWRSRNEGGRSAVPSGPQYITVARFNSQGDNWEHSAWSLVVEFFMPPDTSLRHRVKVHFLMKDAPKELLSAGSEFDLMEGARPVAHGRILNEE
jgi:hypothetical protein